MYMDKQTFLAILRGSNVRTAANYAAMCNVPIEITLGWIKESK